LYCGDCLEILPKLPALAVDAITIDYHYMFTTSSSGNGKLNPWADMCNASYWFAQVIRDCRRLLKQTGCMWQFLNWRTMPTIQKAVFDSGWDITSMLVWDKQWIGPGGSQGLRPSQRDVQVFRVATG
jgi:DNA modification methylase